MYYKRLEKDVSHVVALSHIAYRLHAKRRWLFCFINKVLHCFGEYVPQGQMTGFLYCGSLWRIGTTRSNDRIAILWFATENMYHMVKSLDSYIVISFGEYVPQGQMTGFLYCGSLRRICATRSNDRIPIL